MRTLLVLSTLAALVAAGCVTPTTDVDPAAADTSEVARRVLNTVPAFAAPLLVGATGAGGLGGEPSISVTPDGTIYIAAPMYAPDCLLGLGSFVGRNCAQISVWRSTDGGASFKLLNDADGRLTPDDRGNGDADIAVGPGGRVYAVDLGGGIPFLLSRDGGDTWESKGNLNAKDASVDRQWIDAEGDNVVVTWANQGENPRGIDFVISRDAGETFSEPVSLTKKMIQLGPVELSGNDIYTPYVEANSRLLRVLVSHDLGDTWDDIETGHKLPDPQAGLPVEPENRWSPTVLFPVVAVDKAGTVYVAFSEYREADDGTRLMLTHSKDGGATWTEPMHVGDRQNAVLPWIIAGDAGRVAIATYVSDLALEPNKGMHEWYVELATSFDADGGAATFQTSMLSPDIAHRGSLCPHGGGCLIMAGPYNDRNVLDFFEMAFMPDGSIVATWTADPYEAGRDVRVMFAMQTSGDKLLG